MGRGQCECRRQDVQPGLFVNDKFSGNRPARQAHHEVVAQPEHGVSRALAERREGQVSEIGVLRGEQARDQRDVDGDLGGGCSGGHGTGPPDKMKTPPRMEGGASNANRRGPTSSSGTLRTCR